MVLKRVLPLALTLWLAAHLVQAAAPGAAPVSAAAPAREVEIAPMSDPAIMGAACLGLAATTLVAAYAIGPTELIVLRSGLPAASGPAALFIPMFGILGGAACVLGAVATPSVRWMIGQSGSIMDRLGAWTGEWRSDRSGGGRQTTAGPHRPEGQGLDKATRPPRPLHPMTDTELQSMGCVVVALSGFIASMVTSPAEVAMLASGSTALASSTSVLGLRLLTTVVVAGCGIGSLISTPAMDFISHF